MYVHIYGIKSHAPNQTPVYKDIHCSVATGLIYVVLIIILWQLRSSAIMCMSSLNARLHIPIDVTINNRAAEGAVRLVGGDTLLEGRVEVFLLGQWGTVCDYNWDFVDAIVVCRQLGYLQAVEAPRSAFFGAGCGPSWYSSVYCTGTERNLTECSKSNYNFGSACPHSQDAGAVCSSQSHALLYIFMYT